VLGVVATAVTVFAPAPVSAAAPPVARRDVAGTTLNSPLPVFPLGNDFDPDGDGFSVASVADPAHGAITGVSSNSFVYTPDADFAGADTISYTVEDSTGATAEGAVVVQVDTSDGGEGTPTPAADFLVVCQGSNVGFSVADLLINDRDPQDQPLTVVAVSEPGAEATLTGTLADGFTYTPSGGAGFVNTDHQLAYLVVDPDGHVARETIQIRILAADDTNRPPVAGEDVALTDLNTAVQVFPLGTTSILTVTGSAWWR
jgi:hypothetical protein